MYQEYIIGDFLKRIKRPIELEDDKEYKLVTIRINHKGIRLRGMKRGAEIKSNMYLVKTGDFILSGIDARNGAFGIIPPELDGAIVTNDFWYFEIDESIIQKKLFLELTATNWFDEICKKGSDGTTQRIRLQKNKFFNQQILLPKFENQNKLLSTFQLIKKKSSELTLEIKNQEKLISQLRQAILQEAIEGKLTKDWRAKNKNIEPAQVLLDKIKAEKERLIKEKKIKKQKPLPLITKEEIPFELPKGWVWCRLFDLCKKTGSGKTPKGGSTVYKSAGIKFIRSQNVYNHGLITNNIAFVSEEVNLNMKSTIVKPDDLLLNITGGSIGRCAIVPPDFDIGNINQHVAIIRLINSAINSYIQKVIISPYFQGEIERVQTGAGREGLPKNKMDQILMPIPPFKEIIEIEKRIKKSLSKCNLLDEEINQSKNYSEKLMKAVLKEAFEMN